MPGPSVAIEPLPNETVCSLMARYHLLSGNRLASDTHKELFGPSRIQWLHPYLPTRLAKISESCGGSPKQLLWDHTLFPIFRHCMQSDAIRHLEIAMLIEGQALQKVQEGLPQSRLLYAGHKICSHCAREDDQRYGVPILRIIHQFPGVSACYRHKCRLLGVGMSDLSLKERPDQNTSLTTASSPTTAELKLAATTNDLWSRRYSIVPERFSIETYRLQLRELGLLGAHRLRTKKLVEALSSFWWGLPSTRDCPLAMPAPWSAFEFIGPLIRINAHRSHHPLKHLLLSTWLIEQVRITPDGTLKMGLHRSRS